MDRTWKFLGSGILIHTLEFKISRSKYFPICLYREAMCLQCFLPMRYVMGGASHVHILDDLYQICSKVEYGEPACTMWLFSAV